MKSIDEVFALAEKRGMTSKRWSGARLLTYNGFDHDQRVRKWQALDLAIRMGLEQPVERFPCSVCGSPPSPVIAYHSEDYGEMTGHYPVCKSCHQRLHNRFRSPQRWREFVVVVGNGSKWFENLTVGEGVIPEPTPDKLKPAAVKIRAQSASFPTQESTSDGNLRQKMRSIRIAFVRAMGIKSKEMNPDPSGGYKLEHDPGKRQQCLDEARCLRVQYVEMVRQSGFGLDVLEKMDSNLANRDLRAVWRHR